MQHEITPDGIILRATNTEYEAFNESLGIMAAEAEQLEAFGVDTDFATDDIDALRARVPVQQDRVHSTEMRPLTVTADELTMLCSGVRIACADAMRTALIMRRIRPEISAAADVKAGKYRQLRHQLDFAQSQVQLTVD